MVVFISQGQASSATDCRQRAEGACVCVWGGGKGQQEAHCLWVTAQCIPLRCRRPSNRLHVQHGIEGGVAGNVPSLISARFEQTRHS